MTKEAIKNTLKAVPFIPFRVMTADGRVYHVPEPDFASLSPSGRTLIVHGQGDEIWWLDSLLITTIERYEPTGQQATQS